MEAVVLVVLLLLYLLVLLAVHAYQLLLESHGDAKEAREEPPLQHTHVTIDGRALDAARAIQDVRIRNAAYRRAKLGAFQQNIDSWITRRKDPGYEPSLRVRKRIARLPRLPTITEEPDSQAENFVRP